MKPLGFGVMRLPLTDPEDKGSIDLPAFTAMADRFLERGFTHFDTAWPYHSERSEAALREAVVRRYPRDRFTLTDKMPLFLLKEESQLEAIFSQQLERCGVDHFDYYWLHSLDAGRLVLCEQLHAFEFLLKKQAEGRIVHVGFSFHDTAQVLDQILTRHPEMEYVQLQINYLDWDTERVQSRLCYETARRHGKRIMVMEPVKGGALAQVPPQAEELLRAMDPGRSVPSWAIRFAASLEGVDMVLSGMSTPDQLEDNMDSLDPLQPLTSRETDTLAQVAEVIRAAIAIPCTSCRYCTDGCPQHICIPEYFSLYNDIKTGKRTSEGRFQELAEGHGKPSDCIACGQCEGQCPQHLPIIQHLQTVAKALEG